MKTYRFDITADAVAACEVVEAADNNAAMRQAVLLLSEILRDHALSTCGDIELQILVSDKDGRIIWTAASSVRNSA